MDSHRARAVVCEQWGADATLIPISTLQVGHRGSVGKAVWHWKDCPDQNKSLGVGGRGAETHQGSARPGFKSWIH